MSLVDPKNPCQWRDGTPRSCANGFCLGLTGEPVNWKPLQRSANARRRSTANVDSARKTGKDLSTMHGISKKADTRIVAQRSRTFLIEGRDAGQAATEKRAALKRGGR